ncbi:MAG: hypothetical protein RLP44_08985 [Aggregatilineales bacterium]
MHNKRVTIELKHEIVERAHVVAQNTQRPVEDVLAGWLDNYINELPVENLNDEELIQLCQFKMNLFQQQELSLLLHYHRERPLTREESERLDTLLQMHRRGLVRKARALQVAAARGLIVD